MKRTLVQALLILDYVMNHDCAFEQIGVYAKVNGVLFGDYTYASSFKGKCGEYFQKDAKEQLYAIGKDTDIFVNITTDLNGKRRITFLPY